MNIQLQGKNALVGGSSKGIGKAIAIELAQLGANVTLMARSEALLKEAILELDQSRGQMHDYLVVDYEDTDTLKSHVEAMVSRRHIHILVNNTGGPPAGQIRDASADQFMQTFRHHLIGNHVLTQAVIAGMKADGYGRIINIISTSVKQPLDNLGVSNTVRGAVANWSKTMANELGQFGITVNNVLPGATRTERLEQIIKNQTAKTGLAADEIIRSMEHEIPLRRFAKPAEIAAAVAFLASPAAAYITGINVPVDGGRTKSL